MRRSVRFGTMVALLGMSLGVVVAPASAQTMTFTAEGTVSFVDDDLAGSFSLGDDFRVTYSFESETSDIEPSPTSGRYPAITDLGVSVGGYAASASSGVIFVDHNAFGRDAYQFSAGGLSAGGPASEADVGPYRLRLVVGLLVAPGGSVFSSDALPTAPPDPSDFSLGRSLLLLFEDPRTRETAGVLADWAVTSGPPANSPPDCSAAGASATILWPPLHWLAPIDVLGVTDPDGDPVSVTVDAVFQDEPVMGKGSGRTAPDAVGVGGETVQVRVERSGGGDGRVYHIEFTASDGQGESCSGEVTVGVPHDLDHPQPVDGGALFDSTAP